jgi:hypothetical protein
MNIGMISCRQRETGERAKTLKQFQQSGYEVRVEESPCDPARGAENRRVAFHNILKGLTLGWPSMLFVEDDIDINPPLLATFYRLAQQQDNVVVMCVLRSTLYRPEEFRQIQQWKKQPRLWKPIEPRIVRLAQTNIDVRSKRYYGTQCVYLPRRVMELVRDDWQQFVTPNLEALPHSTHGFDFWICENDSRIGGLYAAFPNPVQHRNPPKMKSVSKGELAIDDYHKVKGGRHMSETYGIPTR